MDSKDLIRLNLERSGNRVLKAFEELEDHAMVYPTANGGCHALWILGHLAYTEYSLTQERMLRKRNPLAKWKALFENGSVALADETQYPSFGEVMGKCREGRDATIALLDTLSESDLDTKSRSVPKSLIKTFGTYRLVFQLTADHWYMHRGQAADIKRAVGLVKG
jgi:hypothetical protein